MRNLFRRREDTASAPTPEVAQALAELERGTAEHPVFSGPAQVLGEVLPIIFGDVAPVGLSLSAEQVAARLRTGVPLLRGEPLQVAEKDFRRRAVELGRIIARFQPAATLDALERDSWNPLAVLRELLAGDSAALIRSTSELGLEKDLAGTVLRLAALPILAALSRELAPLIAGCSWDHGFCPVCGSWPLLGEFRGLEQNQFLRCGLCAGDWSYPRLQCPFCGTRDHRQLGFLGLEGKDQRRVATCDECHGYVKIVSTLSPLSAPSLLVADVATLHLDMIALEEGFAGHS